MLPIQALTDQASLFRPRKFTRRKALTEANRFHIAGNAIFLRSYGTITELAAKFGISRTFVYALATQLKQAVSFVFGDQSSKQQTQESQKQQAIRKILSLRMEGKSPIGGLSTVMERLFDRYTSEGFASETLTALGKLLPNTLQPDRELPPLVLVCDEIFAKGSPILITVHPQSSAILRIELLDNRSGEAWANHFNELESQGIQPKYIVSDEGTGILSGCAQAFPDVIRQSDTFHAIPYKLGAIVERLERSAYAAIEYEYQREATLNSAKRDQVITNRLEAYYQAVRHTQYKIRCYEDFSYLYRCLLKEIKLFDEKGNLRSREQAAQGIELCLSLIDAMKLANVTPIVQQIRATMDSLLHYFDMAKQSVEACYTLGLNKDAVRLYCLAWQWHKTAISKNLTRRHYAQAQEQLCLDRAKSLHQKDFKEPNHPRARRGQDIYHELDQITQSSALIECINSILRPYLNCSKNQVTQEFLNLFMFYHNHRRYADGVRKGKTPMELLTNTVQTDDWIELLLAKAEQNTPQHQ